jgi:hypothetical protein
MSEVYDFGSPEPRARLESARFKKTARKLADSTENGHNCWDRQFLSPLRIRFRFGRVRTALSEATLPLELNGVAVADTFAEAFPIVGTRLIITAATHEWARIAAAALTGYATSVIACDVEAALERELSADSTPDGRPGVSVLVFAFSRDGLGKAVTGRVGQCVLTCPTTACYNGFEDAPRDKQISVGG